MSRRKTAKKRPVAPDAVYQSRLVSLLVSHLLKAGKKSVASSIFYESMKEIAETTSHTNGSTATIAFEFASAF